MAAVEPDLGERAPADAGSTGEPADRADDPQAGAHADVPADGADDPHGTGTPNDPGVAR
jgi:hypothetical protein